MSLCPFGKTVRTQHYYFLRHVRQRKIQWVRMQAWEQGYSTDLPTLPLSDSFTYGICIFTCLHCYGDLFVQMSSILANAFLSCLWLFHVWCILRFFIFWYQCSNETCCSCKVGHLKHGPLKRINNSSSWQEPNQLKLWSRSNYNFCPPSLKRPLQ